ncbi:HD domain-containing protein [Desulfosporosinus sp. HMP52]|uniref:HD domain-containing protein n=1 Tax=Desulfosporosinus sp. HMP52 TaxID=1487923 RepID=UPI0009DD39BE|nr:HD domain-containing protein [Desulfosporosinus sp. HMP52]
MTRNRKQLLRKSIINNSLKQKIDLIQDKVSPLLSRTTNVNIDYTEHTVEHSLNVEELFGACFNEIITLLNDDEKFLLISATLIHDIGMVGQSKYQDEKDYAAEVRDSHQYRSADFINAYRDDLMLEQREAQAIIKIVEGHRVRDLDSIAEKEPYGYGDIIRLRLLAAILRMSDELDILEERAPELVKKYLDVKPESLIHHERHEICTGIARDPETNIIQIKATIPNNRLEHAVIDLYSGIKAKYDELKSIFQKNGIFISSIEIILDTEKVVYQEICLYLAVQGNVNEQELFEKLLSTRRQKEISESIIRLKSMKTIIMDDGGRYSLNMSEKNFKVLLYTFLRTESELEFTRSKFVENYLNQTFDEYVNDRFGVSYSEGDREDRILILTHFPTSLEYFFDPRNTPYEFGNFDRRVTLDLGLLHALCVDVLKYPQELKNETYLAAQAIARKLSDDIFPLLKICSSIPDAAEKKRELIELFEQGIDPFKSSDESIGGKFTVSTTITKNQLPNLDFMTLVFASGIAGVPIEFSKDIAMKDIVFDRDNELNQIHENGLISLKVMPNIERMQFNHSVLFDFDINRSRRELKIKLMKDVISEPVHYPYEFNISAGDESKEITFNLNCNMSGKISEIVKFNGLMRMWEDEGFRRLIIYSGEGGQEPIKIVPPNIKHETGRFIYKFSKIISILRIDTDDCPYLIKEDTIEKIKNLKEEELTESLCSALIQDVKNTIPKQVTKVYLHMNDKHEKTIMTKCLGILPYWFDLKRLKIKSYTKSNKNLIKDIHERNHNLSLRKNFFGYGAKDFYDLVVHTFEGMNRYPIEKVLDYMSKDKGDQVQFTILLNFMAKKRNFWQEEQTIEIIVKINEVEVEKINTLIKLLNNDSFIDAIPLMEELNHDEYLENLAYAYCFKGEYDKSIEAANSAIQRNYRSIAHFTKGLALVLTGEVNEGYTSYMNGAFLVDKKTWHPIAVDNLIRLSKDNDIEFNDAVNRIIDRLNFYSKFSSKKIGKKCFCGSKQHFANCCGKDLIN